MLDKKQIANLLPHRAPMKIIDELHDIEKLSSATANVNVKKNIPIITLCTGSFVLAKLGLLNGKHCAVHPFLLKEMQNSFPEVITDDQKDFIEISENFLGIYHQATGSKATKFKETATQIDPTAIRWIKDWLNQSYTLEL